MLHRVVDISLLAKSQKGSDPKLGPYQLPPAFEPTGKELPYAKGIRSLCFVRPYQIGSNSQDTGMDISIGDNLPHTHAEVLWKNKVTVLDEVLKKNRWAIRSIGIVPAADFNREVAVIDLSQEDLDGEEISAAMLAKHGQHVKQGDFILLRTDFNKHYGSIKDEKDFEDRKPEINMTAAEWLVREKQIVGLGTDLRYFPRRMGVMVHTYFYVNGVLMIDFMINFDQLSDERVFFCGGFLRHAGIGSSPARPVAFALTSNGWGRDFTDMFRPIKPTAGEIPSSPYARIEPQELMGDLYKRFEITWLQFAGHLGDYIIPDGSSLRPQGDFGSPTRMFSSHLGTHTLSPGRELETADLVAPGKVFDLIKAGPRYTITLSDVKKAAARTGFKAGDTVMIRTDFSDLYYYRPDYLHWSPGIEANAIQWLSKEGAHSIVADIASLNVDSNHRGEATHAVKETGLPTTLCATRLWMIRHSKFLVVCSPLPIAGLDAAPSRVVCIETWK